MKSKEIRKRFLEFFAEKSHKIVPSSPIVVHNDPSLMFTNAGMNQFKDYFLGNSKADYSRVADTQKCLRVSGKHNDLEEVGLDTYHHTMFEMLGNWSFGDYFKKEAIEWAWELLTNEFELPKDRLYATVFEGDQNDNLPFDDQAKGYWKTYLPDDRILNGPKKDNFWEMGDVGPCGPCSEIHIDLRDQSDIDKIPGKELVNKDHPLVVELWNLVFMEFNRMADGSLKNLPEKHVDTGMGLERLVMAIQNKHSNYDTDLFRPLINFLENKAGVVYHQNEQTDVAIRVIVDHIRALTFTIADGQLPSNIKAGYVIRRILRRAVRYGYTFLEFKEPFLFEMIPIVSTLYGDVFPEVRDQEEFISKVIKEEETSFLKTLENGLKRIALINNDLKEQGTNLISGPTVFELYDTYGFPVDLTALIAKDYDLTVDFEGFDNEMQKQKDRSKIAGISKSDDWVAVNNAENLSFVGYDKLETYSRVVKYRKITQKKDEFFQLALDVTPFYPEGGGQVGDTGFLENDSERIEVVDTKKENNIILHFTKQLPQKIDADFHCVVNVHRRVLTQNNHSATHLLHAALKSVLGNHVQQRGSFVNHKLLRFDFSHYNKVTDEELHQIEHIVNERIRQNIKLHEIREIPIDEAKKMGATALFGEKYGDTVRVIAFDKNYSLELCGGTHVPATGTIGMLKILSESSIAAGIRRIEAITAVEAEKFIDDKIQQLNDINDLLKSPKDIIKCVSNLLSERSKLQKQIESYQDQIIKDVKHQLGQEVTKVKGINLIIKKTNLPSGDSLKKLSFELKNEMDNLAMILAAEVEEKPLIGVVFSETLIKTHDLHAGKIIKELAREIKGGGGGQPYFATAGGKDLSGLDNVIKKAKELINKQLENA
ncbi:MAG TPA: alanine--tRNA ligase [Cyclobacteriaceae bacterium]